MIQELSGQTLRQTRKVNSSLADGDDATLIDKIDL
jgi:hypothetical protein